MAIEILQYVTVIVKHDEIDNPSWLFMKTIYTERQVNCLTTVAQVSSICASVRPIILSTSPQVVVAINSIDTVTLKCSFRGYPLPALRWRKNGTPLAPNASHVHITTFRRQNPTDTHPFSSTLESNFQPIPLEALEYFEAVSELVLVPPILRTDTANYTCEVDSNFVQNYTEISDNILVKVSGECQNVNPLFQ